MFARHCSDALYARLHRSKHAWHAKRPVRGSSVSYTPTDRLHLWLLMQPQRPVLIGELKLVRSNQGVSLHYAQSWLRSGFPLSEDLPLIDQEFLPADKGT